MTMTTEEIRAALAPAISATEDESNNVYTLLGLGGQNAGVRTWRHAREATGVVREGPERSGQLPSRRRRGAVVMPSQLPPIQDRDGSLRAQLEVIRAEMGPDTSLADVIRQATREFIS